MTDFMDCPLMFRTVPGRSARLDFAAIK